MAFALQGWAVQVSSLLERLEAISGSVVSWPAINGSPEVREGGTTRIGGGLFSSSAPMDPPPSWCEHEEHAPLVVACAKGVSETSVAGCSSEVLAIMALPADVFPTLDVVLHEMVIQHEEEQGTVEEIVKVSNDMEQIEVVLPAGLAAEVPPMVSSPVMLSSGGTTNMMSSGSEELLGDIGMPQGPASTTLLDEFLSSFSCTAPRSLLEAPIHVQIEGASTCSERRSGRLDKKNKSCNIPTAKRAEYRLAEAFGELPKGTTSKKVTEEDVQEKMKSYLRMYKKPLTSTAIQAIRALVEVNV
ncbi:hypothetical protein CFC21_085446 [Triticum aestivum]|uniref:Uncharacterized protein n=2 Tax=Triticum aestivum TaxID=4565 RepID=A0A9R1ID23_WHEAT|nr:hypothetical protein CFC21_085446 [Triticum aestivum]